MGLDMGNSFRFISRPFPGHDMEGSVSGWATAAVCEVGFEGPTRHVAVVSVVPVESEERLQMEETLRAGRPTGPLRSDAPSSPLSATNGVAMVDSHPAFAPTPSQLGKSQAAGPVDQGLPQSTSSWRAHHRPMAQENEAQSPGWSAYSPRTADECWSLDPGSSKQPRLDGGFQRMVSHAEWLSGRAFDGARFVEPLCPDHPAAAGSKLGTGAAGFSAVVPKIWLPVGHSDRQRQSVCIQRVGGAFALERLVDRLGNSGGIHRSRPSRTEWWARANASSNGGGNHSAQFAQPACTTTAHRSMGKKLRRRSSARGVGAADAGRGLSAPSPAAAKPGLELSQTVGRASGEEQWPDPVARTQALCGRSLRWISGRSQTHGWAEMAGPLWQAADRRVVADRYQWDASGQVCSAQMDYANRLSEGTDQPETQRSPNW